MLYKGAEGAGSIPTNDLVPPSRRTRKHQSPAFQTPMAWTGIYKPSYFPSDISLTDFHISTGECKGGFSCKFIFLLRARD